MAQDWIDQRFDELKKLAEERFGSLSEAEGKMLRAAVAGDRAWCGPSEKNNDPLNNASSIDEWSKDREIRAKLVRWICIDHTAESYVDPGGLWIHGAKISSSLKLSYSSIRFPIIFRHCRFTDEFRLTSAKLPALSLAGSVIANIAADGARFQYSVFLNEGFSANGAVNLRGAQIDGNLDCSGSSFKNPLQKDIEESGIALNAARATIKGGVFLRAGFLAEGQVNLSGIQIIGELDCERGTFKNTSQKDVEKSGTALNAARATIKGGVVLRNGFLAEGRVNFWGAQIDGSLDCNGSSLKNSSQKNIKQSGIALNASGTTIKGGVLLHNGFSAEGLVNLWGAQIDGSLDCSGSSFKNPPERDVEQSGIALNAVRATIKGGVLLRNGFRAEGQVNLWGVQVTYELDCQRGAFKNPPQKDVENSGVALNATRVTIKGEVILRNNFFAEGIVNLSGAQIDGNFDCSGSSFKNFPQKDVKQSGVALNASRATIKGGALLRNGFSAEGLVNLWGAQIAGELDCERGTFKNPVQKDIENSGIALNASKTTIKGEVILRNDFSAEGTVNLWGTQIDGNLDCSGSTFRNSSQKDIKQSGIALNASRAIIKGGVLFRKGFYAEGLVSLGSIQVAGELDCERGTFKNPLQENTENSGVALNASKATIKGGVVFRNGFSSEGRVNLWGALIDGSIDCQHGTFKNSAQDKSKRGESALNIAHALVKGSVILSSEFISEGEVSLQNSQIEGMLDCTGGKFGNQTLENASHNIRALSGDNLIVKGSVLLRFNFVAIGQVNLLGSQIGGDLECDTANINEINMQRATVKRALFWRNIKSPDMTKLDLRNATVGSLIDDGEKSWPSAGGLILDGFTYGRIAGGPRDSKLRLKWIGRQKFFSAQSYRQLARILREEGEDNGARSVIYEMEKRKRAGIEKGWRTWISGFWDLIFRGTIGYGIYPRRAIWWLLVLIAMGWGIYHYAYFAGVMTPTNKEAYVELRKKNEMPPNYQHFNALIYSAENAFPPVNLGQRESWSPDPNRQRGFARFARAFRWAQVLFGWALATFFVAGVTGIARKE